MRRWRLRTGARVCFKLTAVVCPELKGLINQVGPELEVVGEVVFVSDSVNQQGRFAIVDVPGVVSPLIVPVGRIRRLGDGARRAERMASFRARRRS